MTETNPAPIDTTAPVADVAPAAVVTPDPTPAPVIAPVVDAAPEAPAVEAPVTPAEPAAPVAPVVEPSLLEKFDAERAEGGEKPADPAAQPPAFDYKYELPASITMDEAQRTEVHGALDKFRENPAEGAQALLDLHAAKMQEFADGVAGAQVNAWNTTRNDWRTKIMADEQLGGARHRTTMAAVARMRDLFVTEGHQQEFKDFLAATGAGDHPAFIRLLHNVARRFDEPAMPPPNPQPPPNNGRGKAQGRQALYTHPTSQK